jgi:hypothetical protein
MPLQLALALLEPFQSPKNLDLQGPLLPMGPRNGFAPIKIKPVFVQLKRIVITDSQHLFHRYMKTNREMLQRRRRENPHRLSPGLNVFYFISQKYLQKGVLYM